MEATIQDLRAEGHRIGTVPGVQIRIDKDRVRKAFSRQAPVYEENAPLQKKVAEKLVSVISSQFTSEDSRLTALDIGMGTGFVTKDFLCSFPTVGVFGCDMARGMLSEARGSGAILTEADIEHLPYKNNVFDLVFSSLAFQWTDMNRSLMEASRILKPHGNIFFASFGEKTLCELSDSFVSAGHSIGMKWMPGTMKFVSDQKVKILMEKAGFKDVEVKADLINRTYRSPEALLRSLKAIGAGNPSIDSLPSRALLQETFRIYRERYGDKKGVFATFEPLYAWGVKS